METGAYPERDARARTAVAGVGWAYLAAMSRGDWARASQLLALFQQLFRSEKLSIVSGFRANVPGATEATIAYVQALSPGVSGMFDEATRDALKVTLMAVVGGADRLDSMPTEANLVGGWFTSSYRYLVPSGTGLWRFDSWAFAADPAHVGADLGARIHGFIEGIDDPSTVAEVATSDALQRSLFALINSRGSAAPRSSPSGSSSPMGPTVEIDDAQLVTATRPREGMSEFWWWVLGLGLFGTAVGVLAYPAYKKYRRIRSH
jgi:hypothetical protein